MWETLTDLYSGKQKRDRQEAYMVMHLQDMKNKSEDQRCSGSVNQECQCPQSKHLDKHTNSSTGETGFKENQTPLLSTK